MNPLAERGAALLEGRLRRAEPVVGGDLSQILRITLADGREAIVKNGPSPEMEAAMLRAIAASGAPAPAVLAVSADALVIEALPANGGVAHGWASLGTALGLLHRVKGERYGWDRDYAFGPITIANGWSEDWPDFWAARRLLPHVPHLAPELARRVESLAVRITYRLPPRPAARLLHGDLWGGNVLVSRSRVSGFIDPACYYGHVEVDLAMLRLFDRPDATFHEAYGPLDAGWQNRLPVYQLWPALVHLRLFGDGYRSMVERVLAAAKV
jgi:fructosamine-3-kinase